MSLGRIPADDRLSLLLAQVAAVAARDADAISDAYAWPPRAPLTDDERREVERLSALSSRLWRAAVDRGRTDQSGDALWGPGARP